MKPCAFLLAAILISTVLAVVTVLHRQNAVNGKPQIVAAVTSFPAVDTVRVALPPSPVGVPPHRGRHPHRPSLDWEALARCESGDHPRAVDPSGSYFGLYQFDLRTWRGVGGRGLPSSASRAEQLHRARLLFADRGSQPWPSCGWRLGEAR